jgi:arylsulfatase
MASPTPPNVVLINVDQWRGDCLGVAGHPVVRTPYLDRLASHGVRFDRAYAACPTCIPARASLYTGLTQKTHGRVGYCDGVEWNYPVTLATEFSKGGYQTHAIGKLHVHPARSRIGFHEVELHDGFLHFGRKRTRNLAELDDYQQWLWEKLGPDAEDFEHGLNCNSFVARPWDKAESLHPTNWVVTRAGHFLRRRDPGRPFFLMLSFHRPHPPFDPPEWAFEQYRDVSMPDRPVGDWMDALHSFEDAASPDRFAGEMEEGTLRRALAGYYGHMSHIDAQINRFLETLQMFDQHANTWVCFVSDHGEMIGDHHLFRKGYAYEGSARVPLVLHGPSGSGLVRGLVSRELAELRDVLPTLLECAGLPVPASVEGRSLLPVARGGSECVRDFLHGEHTIFGQSMQWITTARWKYIWWSGTGREQLFDLAADPCETRDLALRDAAAGELASLRARLIGELDGRPEGFVAGGSLVAGRPVHPVLPHLRR